MSGGVPDDAMLTRRLVDADRPDELGEARDLAELEKRLFGRSIEPVRLSRYVLIEKLAAGGFGSVYLAYDPELDRKVAIKILHGRGGDPDSRLAARDALLREAQALGKFSHPNVVAVYDVGSFEAGIGSELQSLRPRGETGPGAFIVMEHIGGLTLKRWLGAEKRDPDRILEVFLQAGEGLAAAHEAGLVHGDFKPSNVLVGDDGRARVLDFGLARAEQEVSSKSKPRELAGTPAYMAPEQLEGDPFDARADQYAFALSLRYAIFGIAPDERSTAGKLDSKTGDSRTIDPVPSQVRRFVTRALSEDPSLRFPTMREGLDVLGRQRVRKDRVVALVAGLSLMLAGGLAIGLNRGAPACNPEGRLQGIWDSETKARLKGQFERAGTPGANELWRSAASTLDDYASDWSDSWSSLCRATADGDDTTTRFAGQFLCLERDLQRLRGVSRFLSEGDASRVLYANEAALSLPASRRCGADREETVVLPAGSDQETALGAEADIVRAEQLGRMGQIEASVAAAREAMAGAESAGATDTLAAAGLALGTAQRLAGEYSPAERTLEDAMRNAEKANASDLVVRSMAGLVRTLSERGDTQRAQGVLTVAQARMVRGDVSDAAIAELHYQAGVYELNRGEAELAIVELEKGLKLATLTFGDRHPQSANFRNSLGNALKDAGKLEAAYAHIEAAHDVWSEQLGSHHPLVALALNNLGNVRSRQGRDTKAMEFYTRARDVGLAAYPQGHPNTAIFHANLARAQRSQAQYREALENYGLAIEVRQASDEGNTLRLAAHLHSRGYLLFQLGHANKAVVDLRLGAAIYQEKLGRRNAGTLRALDAEAEALSLVGRGDEALAGHESVLAARLDLLGSRHGAVATSYISLSNAHERKGDDEKAHEYREQALGLLQTLPDTSPEDLWDAQARLGRSELRLGRFDVALELLHQAIDLAGDIAGEGAETNGGLAHLELLHDLGSAHLARGELEEARRYSARALALAERTPELAASRAHGTWWLAARLNEDLALACKTRLALADLPQQEPHLAQLAQVDSWLRARKVSSCEDIP